MLKEKLNNVPFLEEPRPYPHYAKKVLPSCPNAGRINSLPRDSERRQLSHNFKCPDGPPRSFKLGVPGSPLSQANYVHSPIVVGP